jgi:flagellar export protein FliJ
MLFRFGLAPLLRLRQSLEQQQALRLGKAIAAVAGARETLAHLDQSLIDAARADESALKVGRSAAEIQFSVFAREGMRTVRKQLLDELEMLDQQRETVAIEYRRAYQEREVLDSLATQQRHIYEQEQLQREQRELDASHLLQRRRKRPG